MSKNLPIISYVILFAVGANCLYEFFNEKGIAFELPYGTFIFVTLNGLIGSLLFTGEEPQDCEPTRIPPLTRLAEIFVKTLALPCFVTEAWLKYGVIQEEAAWVHIVLGILCCIIYVFFDEKMCNSWLDMFVYLNCMSLGIVCFQNDNKYGILSAISFLIGNFILTNDPMDLSPELLNNCLMVFFTAGVYFALV